MSEEQNVQANDIGEQAAEETQVTTSQKTEKNENWIPKARFDEVLNQKKEAQESLKKVVEDMKAEIPENYQSLVPNMKPEDQIKWIQDAKKAGIFASQPISSPEPERPGPSNPNVDFNQMSTEDKIKAGYKKG